MIYWSRNFLEIPGWRPRILKHFEITRTIYLSSERSETCFWRFLRSNIVEQFKLEKIIKIQKPSGKVKKKARCISELEFTRFNHSIVRLCNVSTLTKCCTLITTYLPTDPWLTLAKELHYCIRGNLHSVYIYETTNLPGLVNVVNERPPNVRYHFK